MKTVIYNTVLYSKQYFNLKIWMAIVLSMCGIISAQANNAYSENKLSLHLNDVTVSNVIDAIEDQSEYEFIFNTKAVNLHRRVTINVDNEKIHYILNAVFSKTKTVYEIKHHKILLKKNPSKSLGAIEPKTEGNVALFQQQIRGKVLDEKNVPITGATVVEKNTTNGAITDADGNFSFATSNSNTTLVVSFLGYETKEVSVSNTSEDITITLVEGALSLDDIVITSRRREENLKDVPLSVTAISGNKLEALGAQDITATADLSPNVNFSFGGTSSGSSSAAVVYIRGVGQNDFVPTVDPGVGIYVDGIYLGRSVGAVLDLVDTKRVEVLRGPQGTLFGRNSIGGAISLTSNDPKDTFSGSIGLRTGSYDRTDVEATLHLPISDKLKTSFSGLFRKRDGYVERLIAGDDLGDENVFGVKANVLYEPTDKIRLKAVFDYSREREASAAEEQLSAEGIFPNIVNGGLAPGTVQQSVSTEEFTTNETGPNNNDTDAYGISLTADFELSEALSLKSITAYRDLEAAFARASDGTPFDIFDTVDDYEQSQFSQELQLLGSFDKIDFVTGLYYFTEDAFNRAIASADATGIPAFPFDIGGNSENSSFAIFGEATYHITDKFHLTGGLRYNDEKKVYDPFAITATGANNVTPGERELTFSEMTWRGILAYDVTSSVNTYFSVSKGFKSGGFDVRYTAPTEDLEPTSFLPETVLAYEVGLKTNFKEAGLRFNLSAFISDYEDIQVSVNPPGGVATRTINGAKARINGIELDFDWIPFKNFSLDGSLGLLDAEYTELSDLNELTTEDELIRTPKSSYSLGTSYKFDMKNAGSITPRFTLSSQNDIHFEPVNNDFVFEDGYVNINMFVAYKTKDNKLSITGAIMNLTDERYLIAGDSNGTIGYALGVFALPRNWTLGAKYSF